MYTAYVMNYHVLWDWVLAAINTILSPLMNNWSTARTLTNGDFLYSSVQ